MLTLSSPVTQISHIGRSVEKQLKYLGILTVQDLLFYFPARHDDLSQVVPIGKVRVGERAVVKGRIELIESTRSKWRRKLLTQAVVGDESGSVRVVWFNQPWIAKMFKRGDEVYLVGYVKDDGSGIYFSSPVYEKAGKRAATHAARLVPVYPSTEKLSQKQLRFLVRNVLPLSRTVLDPLPREVRARYTLAPLPAALAHIHFPPDEASLEEARRRLKFDELFRLQLFAFSLKRELKKTPAPRMEFQEETTKRFVEGLSFQLTDDQRKAAWEILGDLTGRSEVSGVRDPRTRASSVRGRQVSGLKPKTWNLKPQFPHPMNRLLEGDVGSGKTVVVAIAALNAVLGQVSPHQSKLGTGQAGVRGQVSVMAPTEILARQHFKTFSKFLEPHGITVELRTSATPRRKSPLRGDVVVGTHALIQKDVQFKNLVLVVVDEQHRFGVKQRAALKEKRSDGLMPHLLTLTATPIPRSLALVFYGDLDISVLREMPKGRKMIETVLVTEKSLALSGATKLSFDRTQAYEFVRVEVKKGHQVFWTCPIIDPSDTLGVKAATEVYEHLRDTVFSDLRVGLIHGRMRSKEREKVMGEFLGISGGRSSGVPEDRPRRVDILVATPVIEVGIDVPNATVMVIEGAERFGLAQLHQFRGRVGRSEVKSYCLLMVDSLPPPPPTPLYPPSGRGENSQAGGEKAVSSPFEGEVRRGPARLQAFLGCDNGFELAERDLELRGPGEVYSGTAQSGFPEFKIASFADVEIAKQAREAASQILAQDPELRSYPQLKAEIIQKEGKTHLE